MNVEMILGRFRLPALVGMMGITLILSGCNPAATNNGDNGTDGTDTGGDDNVLLEEALSFDGQLSGKIVDTQTTRAAFDSAEAGQSLPVQFDTRNTCVRFKDIAGNDLIDPNGLPISEVQVETDGAFDADNLPVGTDFTVCGDIGKDGSCDIESCVNIPADDNGVSGHLTDVQADPLTTVVLAKLRRLIDEAGIDPKDLPVSPAAIVTRIVSAYTNLFEESGIDQEITLDWILENREQLEELFDEIIPAGVRTGIEIVEGNLDAAQAQSADELASAVAAVFLRAGFPIVDFPGGPDLSNLGNLENVTTTTRDELFDNFDFDEFEGDPLIDAIPEQFVDEFDVFFPDGLPEDFIESGGDITDSLPSDLPPELIDVLDDLVLDGFDDFAFPAEAEVLYISEFTEPNRNFADENEFGEEGGVPPLPVISDTVLFHMAELHLQGRVITLNDLYDLLTDINTGLGMRLTYFVDDPHFVGPPLTVFETADGQGLAVNMDRIYHEVFDIERQLFDPADFDNFVTGVRDALAQLLGPTVPPLFGRLFDGIAIGRVAGVEQIANHLRDARAHLPFARTGPSSLFVVADSDSFFGDGTAAPVTVDADLGVDSNVLTVTYNGTGEGEFWLGFTHGTEANGNVHLIVRENGRPVHGQRGPLMLNMFNNSVFQPVSGQSFADFVSETGVFYPSITIPVFVDSFEPLADGTGGAVHNQIWVLATSANEGAEPVRVDYDRTAGVASYNPFGRYLLQFNPDSHETGVFVLWNDATGKPATVEDPDEFFGDLIERPDEFVDFFNDHNNEDAFDEDQLIDDFIGDLPGEDLNGDGIPDDQQPPPPPDGTDPSDPTDPNSDGTDPNAGDPVDPPAPRELFDDFGVILVDVNEIAGQTIGTQEFRHVFGTDVDNPRYNPDGDPYYDDINGNNVQDAGEPTAPFRPTLFDPGDWRSTDVRLYYRQADDSPVTFDEISFDSPTPQTVDGVALVERTYRPRLNAFRFGRPNTAINMLTAFLPPNFFNGTNELTGETVVDIFSAMAIINMVMDQVFNLDANVDVDGFGPLPRRRTLMDAHPFVVPVGDPFVLIIKGFEQRTTVLEQ